MPPGNVCRDLLPWKRTDSEPETYRRRPANLQITSRKRTADEPIQDPITEPPAPSGSGALGVVGGLGGMVGVCNGYLGRFAGFRRVLMRVLVLRGSVVQWLCTERRQPLRSTGLDL